MREELLMFDIHKNSYDSYEFSIVPSTKCDIKCKHCYTADVMKLYGSRFMTEEEASLLGVRIKKFLEFVGASNVNITFTGGEPLTADHIVLEKIFNSLQENLGSVVNESLFLNTNLLMIDDDFLRIFKNYGVKICASFDAGDVRFRKKDLLYLWEKKLEKVLKEAADQLYLSVTVGSFLKEFDFFKFCKERGIKRVIISPLTPVGRAESEWASIKTSRKDLSYWLIGISLVSKKVKDVKVFFTDEDVRNSISKRQRGEGGSLECWGDCFNAFAVLPGGNIHFSGFCFSKDCLGNFYEDDFFSILSHPLRINFILRKTVHSSCLGCEFISFCRCGCVSLAKIEDKEECPGLKKFLRFSVYGELPEDFTLFSLATWIGSYL